jgi:hypothetical protein
MVKSCNALLCIGSYVLAAKLSEISLEIWTCNFVYHPDILYLREQWYEDPWLFSEANKGSESKTVWGNGDAGYYTT